MSLHFRQSSRDRRQACHAFTLLELLAAIAIMAALVTVAGVYIAGYVQSSKQVADQRTLLVLNDALNRYKCEGGDLTALTAGAPIQHILRRLAQTVSWAGLQHSFVQTGQVYIASSIDSLGAGAQYHFTRYNTSSASDDTGNSPVVPPKVIFLTSGTTWNVPADWTANNTFECIGGGGGYGGGGGGYSKIANVSLTPNSTVNIKVGSGASTATAGGDTYLQNNASATIVLAKGGHTSFSSMITHNLLHYASP